jgi:hypothetical protein
MVKDKVHGYQSQWMGFNCSLWLGIWYMVIISMDGIDYCLSISSGMGLIQFVLTWMGLLQLSANQSHQGWD